MKVKVLSLLVPALLVAGAQRMRLKFIIKTATN